MHFRHILSQVAFKARTDISNMEVTIEGIKIYNFHSIGTFTLPTTDAEPTQTDWNRSNVGYTKQGFTAVKGKNIVVSNTATPTSISVDKPMLFIPQQLNKWTTTAENPKSIEYAKNNNQSYLEISCRIKQNDTYLFGKNGFETLYVPFGADWQPGKRYIYTLVFGGGYKADGTPILRPINITADTEPWDDKTFDL